jgi:predicted ester cyclase
MSTEENKAIIRRFENACIIGDWATVDKLTAPNFVYHNPAYPEVQTREQFRHTVIIGLLTAFPDLEFNIEDIIAEGDKVVVRYSFTGTQKGEFAGIPPTNKRIRFTSILINHLIGGKVVERWVESNALSMMLQLGVIPLPAGYFHIKE